jgi:hypothetical protein
MIHRGKIVDGKVVFDSPPQFAEGQAVEVRPLATSLEADLSWIKQFEGVVKDLPPDASASVDQVLYGTSEE